MHLGHLLVLAVAVVALSSVTTTNSQQYLDPTHAAILIDLCNAYHPSSWNANCSVYNASTFPCYSLVPGLACNSANELTNVYNYQLP